MGERISDDELRSILTHCTRGPWQRSGVRSHEPKHKGHLVGPDGDGVVSVPYWDKAHAECMANARLIALAPALAAEVLQLREDAAGHQWRSMDSAPTDGTHVLLAVKTGPFVHVIQGAFYEGKWMDAADRGGEYLCWKPNELVPDEYLPWTDEFKARAALSIPSPVVAKEERDA